VLLHCDVVFVLIACGTHGTATILALYSFITEPPPTDVIVLGRDFVRVHHQHVRFSRCPVERCLPRQIILVPFLQIIYVAFKCEAELRGSPFVLSVPCLLGAVGEVHDNFAFLPAVLQGKLWMLVAYEYGVSGE